MVQADRSTPLRRASDIVRRAAKSACFCRKIGIPRLFPSFGRLPANLFSMKQTTQPRGMHLREFPMLHQVLLQLGHRPIGEGHAHIRRLFFRDLLQGLQLPLSNLCWSSLRIGATIKSLKTVLVEFRDTTTHRAFVAT